MSGPTVFGDVDDVQAFLVSQGNPFMICRGRKQKKKELKNLKKMMELCDFRVTGESYEERGDFISMQHMLLPN